MRLKATVAVTAGVVPGQVMREHTRAWSYTDTDLEADRQVPQDQPTRFSKLLDEAHEYAKGLTNPAFLNWVKVEWIWL